MIKIKKFEDLIKYSEKMNENKFKFSFKVSESGTRLSVEHFTLGLVLILHNEFYILGLKDHVELLNKFGFKFECKGEK